jgi:hypothetical protein
VFSCNFWFISLGAEENTDAVCVIFVRIEGLTRGGKRRPYPFGWCTQKLYASLVASNFAQSNLIADAWPRRLRAESY